MKIAICDDSKTTLEYVSEKIKDIFYKKKYKVSIQVFDKSKDLIKCLKDEFFDVVFLDIDMPNFSGFDIAKKVQVSVSESIIVFFSNLEEKVYESLQFRPFRFIRKSHFDQEINDVIEALIKTLICSNEYIKISLSKEQIKLYPHKIIYIECNDKTLKIVSNGEIIELRYRLRDMEVLLNEYGFIRIHKGYLVNSKYIYRINKSGEIILESGEKLPVSKRRVRGVFEELGRVMV